MEYALVTGANRGIGYHLAKELARDGYNLVLVGRNKEGLEEAKNKLVDYGVRVLIMVHDLKDPKAPERLYEDIKSKDLRISALVNNAGFGIYGAFVKNDIQTVLELMQVNMNALVHLTHLFAPDMISRGYGRILNVSSVAGFQPGPHMNIYFASKAFVLSFSQALRFELKNTGVSVTTLCPGSTDTNFFERAHVSRKADLFKMRRSPEKVAHTGYKAMKKRKGITIPGIGNKIMIQAQRFAPRSWVTCLSGHGMSPVD